MCVQVLPGVDRLVDAVADHVAVANRPRLAGAGPDDARDRTARRRARRSRRPACCRRSASSGCRRRSSSRRRPTRRRRSRSYGSPGTPAIDATRLPTTGPRKRNDRPSGCAPPPPRRWAAGTLATQDRERTRDRQRDGKAKQFHGGDIATCGLNRSQYVGAAACSARLRSRPSGKRLPTASRDAAIRREARPTDRPAPPAAPGDRRRQARRRRAPASRSPTLRRSKPVTLYSKVASTRAVLPRLPESDRRAGGEQQHSPRDQRAPRFRRGARRARGGCRTHGGAGRRQRR